MNVKLSQGKHSSWLLFLTFVSAFILSMRSPYALAQEGRLLLTEAKLRSEQVKDVHYDLSIELSEADQPFRGQVLIDFFFTSQGRPLRIDFDKGKVESVRVNGNAARFSYDGTAIYLEPKTLKNKAANQVQIRYEHAYSRDGNGLYRFQDPVDREVYLYTHFEPYEANQLFPCFDQPDLKATYKMSVTAPAKWTVVSATREESIQATQDGNEKVWNFPRTLRFSTYLISLHAGPFKVWEDPNFRYPLRLMARRSLADYVPHQEWLATTRQGFDYFDKAFAYPYPFAKYDQVAVPDFNAGAMENVAAVTFSERFLVRGHRSKAQAEGLAHTLLHEMAHMWFGNLVTMRWWDDLWLNESFATYASTLALASLPEYPRVWLGNTRSKASAYAADELVTTHPIVATIPHTDAAMANFDAITYGKGAAFLRQLHFVIGDEAFFGGLRHYFKAHAFQNTEVRDFIQAMEKSAGRSLATFTQDWLHTAGPNTLSVSMQCKGGKIESFELVQTAPEAFPTLREHRTKVGLYRYDEHLGFSLLKQEAVSYSGPRTAWKGAKGTPCPDLVFPNDEDYDYVKVQLDPETREKVQKMVHRIAKPQLRMMIWLQLASMVENAEVPLGTYLSFYQEQLPRERDYEVLRAIDSSLDRQILPYIENLPEPKDRLAIAQQLLAPYAQRFASPKTEVDTRLTLFGTYVRLLTLGQKTKELLALLNGPSKGTLTLSQDQRWEVLLGLSGLGYPEAKALITREQERDPSSLGQRQALAAAARWPDYNSKLALIDPIVKKSSPLSASYRAAIISHLFPAGQDELRQRYAETYKKSLGEVVKQLEPGVARSYVSSLLPRPCHPERGSLIQPLLEAGYTDSIQKSLLVARQQNERCLKMIELAQLKGFG